MRHARHCPHGRAWLFITNGLEHFITCDCRCAKAPGAQMIFCRIFCGTFFFSARPTSKTSVSSSLVPFVDVEPIRAVVGVTSPIFRCLILLHERVEAPVVAFRKPRSRRRIWRVVSVEGGHYPIPDIPCHVGRPVLLRAVLGVLRLHGRKARRCAKPTAFADRPSLLGRVCR